MVGAMSEPSRGKPSVVFSLLLAGCSSGGGGGASTPADDWQRLSGETQSPCNSGKDCSWANVGPAIVDDFAFDGDDILVMGQLLSFRLALASGTGARVDLLASGMNSQIEVVPAGIFVKGNAHGVVRLLDRAGAQVGGWGTNAVDLLFDVALRALPNGHVVTAAPRPSDSAQMILVDIDPAVATTVTETALSGWGGQNARQFAVDELGRIFFETGAPGANPPALNVLDRSTGQIATVVFANPPPTSTGSTAPAFTQGSGLWGPAPGGGVLAVRDRGPGGMDIVRLTATAGVSLVVPAPDGAIVKRLRARDGFLYLAGFGLWRTRRPVF